MYFTVFVCTSRLRTILSIYRYICQIINFFMPKKNWSERRNMFCLSIPGKIFLLLKWSWKIECYCSLKKNKRSTGYIFRRIKTIEHLRLFFSTFSHNSRILLFIRNWLLVLKMKKEVVEKNSNFCEKCSFKTFKK